MFKRNFLQVFCFTCIALAQSFRLSSRKQATSLPYDPHIICDRMGPTHSEGLPPAYNEQVYAELISLCSFVHGARENVGCFCSTANGNVHCDPQLADSNLWEARFTPQGDDIIRQFEAMGSPNGNRGFPQLCESGCECVNEEDADIWYHQQFDQGDMSQLIGAEGILQPSQPSENARQGSDTFAEGSFVGNVQPADHPRWQNQCGNNCSSAKDCSIPAGGHSTCTCQAHSSQYQPGSGTVSFIAACLVTLGSGGKREEGLPCPCNGTYVSHSCCDVLDGFVWEPLESKLGNLR